jgi:hypothetical protein
METFIKTPIGQALRALRDITEHRKNKEALLNIKEQVQKPSIDIFGREDLIKTIDRYIRRLEA